MRHTAYYTLILLGACALLCSGCAQGYQVTLTNGSTFVSSSKPKLKGNAYYYKDASGREQYIPQGRVREIAPAGRAVEEKSRFISSPNAR